MKKHIIWSNNSWDDDFEEKYHDEILEMHPELTDQDSYEIFRIASELNENDLEQIRNDLNIETDNDIIVIAELGLWNGKQLKIGPVGGHTRKRLISQCLYTECDFATWYIDEAGDFCCEAVHHDGTNMYLFRELKDDAVPEDIQSKNDAIAMSRPIGPVIADAYGWEL